MTEADDSIADDGSILAITVRGPATVDRIVALVSKAYATNRSDRVCWDLTHGEVAILKPGDFMHIAARTVSIVRPTRQRRVAFIVADTKSYIRMCEYVNEAFSEHVPAEYAVFRDAAQARAWLLRSA